MSSATANFPLSTFIIRDLNPCLLYFIVSIISLALRILTLQTHFPAICMQQLIDGDKQKSEKNRGELKIAGQDLQLPPPKTTSTPRQRRPKAPYRRHSWFNIYADVFKNISTAEMNIAFKLKELLICRGHGLTVS